MILSGKDLFMYRLNKMKMFATVTAIGTATVFFMTFMFLACC